MDRTILRKFIFIALTSVTINCYADANPTNNLLLGLSPADQADALGKAVTEGCTGQTAFYMGSVTEQGPDLNSALWSVKCSNGKSYIIKLLADKDGSTRVINCDEFQKKTGIACFTKLK